jgi:hypothetical protein
LICCPIYFFPPNYLILCLKNCSKVFYFLPEFFGGQHPTLLDGVHLF